MGKNERERILILGAGVMQGPAIALARNLGLETVVVDGDPGALHAGDADRFEPIDLKDREGLLVLGRSLLENGGLAGVMTAGTDFSASVAWVAEKLDLPGIPYEAALDASDKERMRRRFAAAGLPSPAFVIMGEVPAAAVPPAAGPGTLPFPYPVVVKPVDNMGARGCRRVDSFPELRDAVEDALRFSRSRRAIVEEYMEGPEFSVDAVVYHGEVTICGLADRHIFFPPYFIEMGHTMPASIDGAQQNALLDVFIRGIRALEIRDGAAKGDIKLTARGPMIGEIAARLSGGYMSGWTYPYASGVEPARGAIQAALGRKPDCLDPVKDWTSAERAFISIPGLCRSIEGLEAARAVPCVRDLFLRAEPGQRLRFPENNVTKAGNVISAAPGREAAVTAAEEAARAVLIRLAAPDAETAAFLELPLGAAPGVAVFPPPAFSLTAELLAALGALPDPAVPGKPPAGKAEPVLLPFPVLAASDLRDYQGRTVEQTLEAVRRLTNLALQENIPEKKEAAGSGPVLGRSFWTALVRGGYQGAVYHLDLLMAALLGGT